MLLGASVVFTLGAAIMAAAPTFGALLIGRTVVGVGVGVASAVVPMYIAELSPAHLRGTLVALVNACIVSGQVSAALIDGAFSGVAHGWRYMLGIGGLPSALQFIALLFMPESPR